jgi:uncharacterized protein YegP (UPF0339 family)
MIYRVFAAVVVGVALCTMSLDAQGTKKAPGSIEIYKNKDGEFRYRIKGPDGKTIAMPLPQMTWDKKADVLKSLNELKVILQSVTPIDAKDEETKEKKVKS